MADAAVRVELARGYPIVCASCEDLHEARALGHADGCMALLRGQSCGSPLRGNDFPLYRGPLADALLQICFVCGAPSDSSAAPRGKLGARRIGVCRKHLELFKQKREDRSDEQTAIVAA